MINNIGKIKLCFCDSDDARKRCYFDLHDILARLTNSDQSKSFFVEQQSSFMVIQYQLNQLNRMQDQLLDTNIRILSAMIDDKYREAVKKYKKLTAQIDSRTILHGNFYPQDSDKLFDLHSGFLVALTNMIEYIVNEPIEYIKPEVIQNINKTIDHLIAIIIEKFIVDHSEKLDAETELFDLSDDSLERKLNYQIGALCSIIEDKLRPIEDKLAPIIFNHYIKFGGNPYNFEMVQNAWGNPTISSITQPLENDWLNYSVQFFHWFTNHCTNQCTYQLCYQCTYQYRNQCTNQCPNQHLITRRKQEYKNITKPIEINCTSLHIKPFDSVDIDHTYLELIESIIKSVVTNNLTYSFDNVELLLLEILRIKDALKKNPTFSELFGNFIKNEKEDKDSDTATVADLLDY